MNTERRPIWPLALLGAALFVGLLFWMGQRRPADTGTALESFTRAPRGTAPLTGPITAENFFGIDRMHPFEVEMAAGEWDILQTSVGRGPRGQSIVEEDYTDSDGRLIHRSGGFGGTFPWVHSDLTAPGHSLRGIGLRYKGNASFTGSEGMLRRNLKVKTDVYGDGTALAGMKTLNFNAGALDPSRVRESLSYAIFRAAGVPAPRTTFAEVTFTVPGRFGKQVAGVYTVVEQINKTFLKRALPPGDGILFKPERLGGGITYYGEIWAPYDATYRPEREPTEAEKTRLIEFARLVATSSSEEFTRGIESYLDVDEFLRYVAVNALLVNMDSFLNGRHNFYLYLDPRTNRFVFLPWDQDLSMGAMGRGTNQILDLSLDHPYSGQNLLISRMLDDPGYLEKYRAILTDIADGPFSSKSLHALIETVEETTGPAIQREADAANHRNEPRRPGRGPSTYIFLSNRLRSVQRQLSGASSGTIPPAGRGGGF